MMGTRIEYVRKVGDKRWKLVYDDDAPEAIEHYRTKETLILRVPGFTYHVNNKPRYQPSQFQVYKFLNKTKDGLHELEYLYDFPARVR